MKSMLLIYVVAACSAVAIDNTANGKLNVANSLHSNSMRLCSCRPPAEHFGGAETNLSELRK